MSSHHSTVQLEWPPPVLHDMWRRLHDLVDHHAGYVCVHRAALRTKLVERNKLHHVRSRGGRQAGKGSLAAFPKPGYWLKPFYVRGFICSYFIL